MATAVLGMAQGRPLEGSTTAPRREAILAIAPPAVLAAFVLVLGLYLPPALRGAVEAAAHALR